MRWVTDFARRDTLANENQLQNVPLIICRHARTPKTSRLLRVEFSVSFAWVHFLNYRLAQLEDKLSLEISFISENVNVSKASISVEGQGCGYGMCGPESPRRCYLSVIFKQRVIASIVSQNVVVCVTEQRATLG